jgi:ribosomal protein L36
MRIQQSVKKSFDKAKVISRKAVERVPASTKRGFHNGRKAGHDFVENVPYGVGAVVGFVYGAGEAIVDCAISAIGGAWAGEEEGAAETA